MKFNFIKWLTYKVKRANRNRIVSLTLLALLVPMHQNCGSDIKTLSSNSVLGDNYSYEWVIGSYGECSATACGTTGVRTRTVQCARNDGLIVDDSKCTTTKPQTTQSCSAPSCDGGYTYVWRTGDWGACSATQCNANGTQTRVVECVRNDNQVVADSFCSGAGQKPQSSRSCQGACTYAWSIGDWGACSAVACGTSGTRNRTVQCMRSDNSVVNDSNCPSPKPATSEVCHAAPCDTGGGGSMTTQITVHNYASGTGPADLVSNGIPFKSGVLTNLNQLRILDGTTEVPIATKVLARWPNNSIRVALVQFLAPFSGSTKTYTVSVGTNRTTTDRSLVTVNFKYPKKIAVMSADYLSKSLIMWEQTPFGQSGFPAWETKQRNNFSAINREPSSSTSCSRDDHYYDAANTSYQLYVRSGELQYLTNGRRWAYHHGRDQIHLTGSNTGFPRCTGNYLTATRYTFVDSLVRDYMFWGDEESLRVAGLVVTNFYAPHASSWYYKAPKTRGFWTEREAAFAQLGLIAYYEATGNQTYLNLVRDRVHSLHKMQVDNGNTAWVHNLYDHDPDEGCPQSSYGSSSFMSGLLAESLIRYHKLTKDPIAQASVLMAADYLRANNVSSNGNGFVYLGCRTVYNSPEPDIDLLIVHLFGYAYRLSNYTNQNYLNLGRTVFNYSVSNGYAGNHKQYNQHFRSSGHFPAYIKSEVETYEP